MVKPSMTDIDVQPLVHDIPKANDPQLSIRLLLTVLAAFAIVDVVAHFLRMWASSHLSNETIETLLISDLLFSFTICVICVAVVVGRRRARHFLGPFGKKTLFNAAVGVAVGLIASVAVLPVAFGKPDLFLEWTVVFSAYEMRPWGLLGLALLLLGLPLVGELVFRGIALEGLQKHFSFPVAALASCIMYVLFWPALNPLSRFVFAALAALSYRKTGNVFSSVIGNAILAFASCAAALRHHLG